MDIENQVVLTLINSPQFKTLFVFKQKYSTIQNKVQTPFVHIGHSRFVNNQELLISTISSLYDSWNANFNGEYLDINKLKDAYKIIFLNKSMMSNN